MPIDLYPNIAKIKRGGVYQNLPGFVQQSGDADILSMIANSEISTTAQYAHPKGSYFILNDILYKAKIDIAVNDTIAVGTNCEVAILGNEVSKIEDDVSNLKSSFNPNVINSKNEFNNKWTTGGYIDPSTGNIISASTYKYSDFCKLKAGTKRTLFVRTSTAVSGSNIIRYNANKEPIGNRSISASQDYPIDDNVVYIRVYSPVTFTGNIYISTEIPDTTVNYDYITGRSLEEDSLPNEFITEAITSDNLFSGYWTTGGYINVSNDTITSASTYKYTPEYIKVPEGISRILYAHRDDTTGSIYIIRYDKNYNIIGYTSFEQNNTDTSYAIENNTAFLRMYVPTTFTGDLYVSTIEPSTPVDYTYNTALVIKSSKVEHNENPPKEITVVNFGDSIYGNFQDNIGNNISVSAIIQNMTGYNVINGGFGGCRMSSHTSGWDAFSMYQLAKAITTGDWTAQDAAWADHTTLNLPYYFGTTLNKLKSLDFFNVDIITIEYGTNDWASSNALDAPSEDLFDTDTFAGALRYSIKTILETYPNMLIVVQNPTPRFKMSGTTITETSDTALNTNNKTLVDLIGVENDVCKEYKIPVIDAYYESLINVYTHDYYMYSDTEDVHLGLHGRERLANIVAKFLTNKL